MDIGKILREIRTGKKISMDRLSEGICSKSSLMNIESGWRVPDKLLLDALLERLGKSPDKLETVLSWKDYASLVERERILKAIDEEKYDDAAGMVARYEKKYSHKNSLHRQFIDKCNALIVLGRDGDIRQSIQYIEYALEEASAMFCGFGERLLSKEDIQLLIMYSQENLALGEKTAAEEILDYVLHYVEGEYTDEELRVKIYPEAAYYRAEMFYEAGDYGSAAEICEKGVECLAANGFVTWLPELLELDAEVQRLSGNTEMAEKRQRHFDALTGAMMDFAGVKYESHRVQRSKNGFKNIAADTSTQEICLVGELVRNLRISSGITQAGLSEGICEPETVSRIETGRAPKRENLEKLMTRLQVERSYYNGFIDDDSFEVHELKREFERMIGVRRYDDPETGKMLARLERKLDMSKNVNRQYIDYVKTALEYKRGRLSEMEAIEKYGKALALTAGDIDYMAAQCEYTKTEALLVYNIGTLHRALGKHDEAIKIYEGLLSTYSNSRIDMKHHYVVVSLAYLGLARVYWQNGRQNELREISSKAFSFCLSCNRMIMIPDCIMYYVYGVKEEISETQDDIQKMRTCRRLCLQARNIAELMNDRYGLVVSDDLYSKVAGD